MRGMKKKNLITCLCLSLLIALFIAGCGKSTQIQDAYTNSEKDSQSKESQQAQDTTEGAVIIQQEASDKDTIMTKENHADTKTNSGQEVASVIVKSDNNLSDSEKKQIVDQLSKEVDELLTEINADE